MKVSKNDVLKVEAIIQHCGGYREKTIMRVPHNMEYISWGNGHTIVRVMRQQPDPEFCSMFCVVDITTREIVG